MTLNYLLCWIVAISGASGVLRNRKRREIELISFYRFAVGTVLTLICALLIVPSFAGYIAAVPWIFGMALPTFLLNRIIKCYEGEEFAAGERAIQFARIIPATMYWNPAWRDLYAAEYAASSNQLGNAVQIFSKLRVTDSLVSLYAHAQLLAYQGNWSEVIEFSKPYSEESPGKPSLFFTKLLIAAYAASDEVMKALGAFEKVREHFPVGSYEERKLLQLLVQVLPPHRTPKLLEELKENRAADTSAHRPLIVYGLSALLVVAFLFQVNYAENALYQDWVFDPLLILLNGEWWRIATCALLHAGLLHLSANLLGIIVLGPFLEGEIGRVRFATVFMMSVLGSSLFVLLLMWWDLIEPARMIGASGGVMGIVGSYAGLYLNSYLRTGSLYYKTQLRKVLLILLLQTLFDVFTPRISFSAHFGGFMTGLVTTLVGLRVVIRR